MILAMECKKKRAKKIIQYNFILFWKHYINSSIEGQSIFERSSLISPFLWLTIPFFFKKNLYKLNINFPSKKIKINSIWIATSHTFNFPRTSTTRASQLQLLLHVVCPFWLWPAFSMIIQSNVSSKLTLK